MMMMMINMHYLCHTSTSTVSLINMHYLCHNAKHMYN